MPSRALAFVLALVLLWSGLATQEQMVPRIDDESAHVSSQLALQQQLDDGSVNDHHLDDLPAQAHAETPMDMQALLMDCVQLPVIRHPCVRYRPYAGTEGPAPYLEGPQRPPRAPALTA